MLNVTMAALLVVAVALGLNNFGAAIAIGVSGVDRRTEIKVATVFGLCDVVMPATGMLIGTGDAPQAWHGWRLLVSGAALSLDDLAVGLALGTARCPIVLAVTLFGLMSFVMSVIGLKLGGKLGTAAGEHGEVAGAIVLIGISGAMAMGWLLPGGTGTRSHRGPGRASDLCGCHPFAARVTGLQLVRVEPDQVIDCLGGCCKRRHAVPVAVAPPALRDLLDPSEHAPGTVTSRLFTT
jgi:manganese efflux pump family protein